MQRAGTLRYMGPPRPGPLLNRPRGDKCSEQGKPSQANRGPKNLGRSATPSMEANSTTPKLESKAAGADIFNPGPKKGGVLINIDKANQKMTVFLDEVKKYEWPVSTGRAG